MNGASMAPFPPAVSVCVVERDLAAIVRHCCGSAMLMRSLLSFTSFNPPQNEPKLSHASFCSSTTRFGSMAFQLSLPGTDCNSLPLSSHLKSGEEGLSVLLTATPLFPYSLENTNTGYSQTVANCNYTWTIGGVGQFTGSSVWFTPPAQSGYYVDLKVQDAFPHQANIFCKVRVSQTPFFTGTGPLADTVCLGVSTNLIGGVTATDTVGIDIPGGEFQIGGVFAGLTFLPDGAGQTYSSVVPMSGFDSTAVITSANDFDELCIDIEHSYIGDIEIALTCPNGTTVSLMNAYNQTPFGWNE